MIGYIQASLGSVAVALRGSPQEGTRLRVTDISIACRGCYYTALNYTALSQPTRIGKPSPASSVVVS